jgi:hypothetical protein
MSFLITPEENMPTFVVRQPKQCESIYVGDFFEHPTYGGVVVKDVQFDERAGLFGEVIVTYRAATRQDMIDHGMIDG